MTFPEDRLRAADPARALPAQPDQRAEYDLALLLGAPDATASSPAGPRSRPDHGRRSAGLVTALVAAAVLAMTVAVLALVHPKTATPAEPSPNTCATTGEDALLCGTFRSTGGTGDLAFLTTRPYTLVFTRETGLTMVLSSTCDSLRQAITLTGSALEVGDGGGTSHGCSTEEQRDHEHLAEDLYAPDITYRLHGDTLVLHFGYSHSSATFTRTTNS